VLSDYSTYKHPFSIPIAHNLLGQDDQILFLMMT
jgi:hypothetical protein